jgi:preprotein translocase subunit SecB
MSDQPGGNGSGQSGPQGQAQAQGQPQPQLTVNVQYVKDLSFENPNAPQSLTRQAAQPQVTINVDVQARGVAESMYEVTLRLTANAAQGSETAFVAELLYAGVFTLRNIPREHIEAVCLIECPRLLFPFARRIMADVTRDGGFPPLMMEPIDFVDLYRRSRQPQAAAAAPDTAPKLD